MNNQEIKKFYESKAWKVLRARMKNSAIKHGRTCNWCKKPLLKGQNMIADHIIMLRKRPDLRLDPNNIQMLHHACHSKKTVFSDYNDKDPIDVNGYPESWQ